jgi:methylated-DNA-protein-cysteine methyltransferase-like protein
MEPSPFTQKVIQAIRSIPRGKVTTYGAIATMAGNRRAARQVARILHSCSRKEELPWHRVVNREGKISLGQLQGYDLQKSLLLAEGIEFDHADRILMDRFQWPI